MYCMAFFERTFRLYTRFDSDIKCWSVSFSVDRDCLFSRRFWRNIALKFVSSRLFTIPLHGSRTGKCTREKFTTCSKTHFAIHVSNVRLITSAFRISCPTTKEKKASIVCRLSLLARLPSELPGSHIIDYKGPHFRQQTHQINKTLLRSPLLDTTLTAPPRNHVRPNRFP